MGEEKKHKGITTPKKNFSKWFSEVIFKAKLCDMRYNAKGFLVHRPNSVLSMKAMYKAYERELESRGHKPVWFPAVIPESNFKKESEHVEGFAPEVFWVETAGSGTELPERLALRPTSETAMYKMYSKWIRSWRDLPMKLYQSCQVWRHETKATRPFIRGREFHWIEAHDVFSTRKEAEAQVKEDMQMTENVMHKQFGIPFIFFRRPYWDKFAGAVDTYAADTLMPDGKILQQPSTHLLGQNFSKTFGINFENENGEEELAWQTCYGPCIWRIFASVVAQHGDDKGLVFPFDIAPTQVVIIPVGEPENKALIRKCKEILNQLRAEGYRAELDDSEKTAGWKFNEWEMRGVPIRIEVGPKEMKKRTLTLMRRDTGKRQPVPESKLAETIPEMGQMLTSNLVRKADTDFKKNIHTAKTMNQVKKILKKGGFIRINFCSDQEDGIACAEKLQEETHAHVRGVRADMNENPAGKCIVCGKKANAVVYVGRQY